MNRTVAVQSSFLDGDDKEILIPRGATDDFLRPYHTLKNRRLHDTKCFCPSCKSPCHLRKLAAGIWMVCHNPGHGNGACEYTDIWNQISASGGTRISIGMSFGPR